MQSDTSPAGPHQDGEPTIDELKRELAASHRREAATAEVLRVISRSLTEAQPVFDIIATSALQLVGAQYVGVVLYDGELQHLVALNNSNPEGIEAIRRAFPRRLDDRYSTGRAILSRGTVQVPDVLEDVRYELKDVQQAIGWRSVVAVPMLRDSEPIGAIAVGRTQPGPFSDKHVELLKTFADQVVIAIENTRLFTELREKNGALTQAHAQVTETLEQQTATSEILRVISSSPTDIQPVFDAIIANAMRLCEGEQCVLLGREGGTIT